MNISHDHENKLLQKSDSPHIISVSNGVDSTKKLGESSCAVRRQSLMVILANIGILSIGMALSLPAVTLGQLKDTTETVHLSKSQSSWYASLNTLSSPLGGLICAFMLDKFGRKNTLYTINLLSIVAWVLMAFAYETNSTIVYIQLLISRFIMGISNGMGSAPAGVYSAEISLPRIRGCLILGTSISIASGITLMYFLGYLIRNDWHLIALISCAYQIVSLMLVIPIPETPSWLLSKGRVNEAKASLNYFRGLEKTVVITHPEVQEEFNLLQKSIQSHRSDVRKPSFFELFRLPEVYKPLLILMGLFAFQQLSGIFVIIVYAIDISIEAGVSIDPFVCAVMIGLARLITTCPMGYILEKWGRRLAGMISAFSMSICMFLLVGYNYSDFLQSIPYLPVIAIVTYIVASTLGIYTLPFFLISELFPQKVRGAASGITVAFGMFLAFICIKIYPFMKSQFGHENCFLFYGVAAFLATIFVYFFLPETRGRTLLEIEDAFRNRNKNNKNNIQANDIEMHENFVK